MNTICAVFLCDMAYFDKFIKTCGELVTNGKYNGNICLVIGDDLINNDRLKHDMIVQNRVIIKHFADIHLDETFLHKQQSMNRPSYWNKKLFQYHKLYLFDTFFKQWDTIFYVDCGITIFSDISPILNERKPKILLAHSDAFPTYEWKLRTQFDQTEESYETLEKTYNLTQDYFQTTIMLYDTQIIEYNTFANLRKLMFKYPCSITNDQGIIALYFTQIIPVFEQIRTQNDETYFYDYLSRNWMNKYIMLKML